MKSSKNSKKSFDSKDDENNTKLNRSREKEELDESDEELESNIENYNNTKKSIPMKISIEDCIKSFDKANLLYLKNNKHEKKIIDDVKRNTRKTPDNKSQYYTNKIIELIKNMKKETDVVELPCLPYGQHLTDNGFISLLEECIKYANYNLDKDQIEKIKSRLLNSHLSALQNLFQRGQALKDLIENALLTILTSKEKTEQDDNFNLLNIERTTATPIINMNFGNKDDNKLNSKEFADIFSSPVYLTNYLKTLKNFTDKVPPKQKLKNIIKEHFINYYIYFSELPQNILALIVHTGNIYINDKYLFEYYNEKTQENLLIIRQKIILNIGHELNHGLLREISDEMRQNFLLKSNNNNKKIKGQNIEFKDKFISKFHLLDKNESGNLFDYNFFNNYYFEDIYPKEAELFFNIKSIKSITDYEKRMNEIIKEEKNESLSPEPVNKFKKLYKELPRRCIRSRILGTIEVSEKKYNEKDSDNNDSSSS